MTDRNESTQTAGIGVGTVPEDSLTTNTIIPSRYVPHLSEFYPIVNNTPLPSMLDASSTVASSDKSSAISNDHDHQNNHPRNRHHRGPASIRSSATSMINDLQTLITRRDVQLTHETMNQLHKTSQQLAHSLAQVSQHASDMAMQLENFARLKGCNDKTAEKFMNASGLFHLLGNHEVIMCDLIHSCLGDDLVDLMDEFRVRGKKLQNAFSAKCKEQSQKLKIQEKFNNKFSKQNVRNLISYRESLNNLQLQLDQFEMLKIDYYNDSYRLVESYCSKVLDKLACIARAQVEISENIARKGWAGGGLDELLIDADDPFMQRELASSPASAIRGVIPLTPNGEHDDISNIGSTGVHSIQENTILSQFRDTETYSSDESSKNHSIHSTSYPNGHAQHTPTRRSVRLHTGNEDDSTVKSNNYINTISGGDTSRGSSGSNAYNSPTPRNSGNGSSVHVSDTGRQSSAEDSRNSSNSNSNGSNNNHSKNSIPASNYSNSAEMLEQQEANEQNGPISKLSPGDTQEAAVPGLRRNRLLINQAGDMIKIQQNDRRDSYTENMSLDDSFALPVTSRFNGANFSEEEGNGEHTEGRNDDKGDEQDEAKETDNEDTLNKTEVNQLVEGDGTKDGEENEVGEGVEVEAETEQPEDRENDSSHIDHSNTDTSQTN